MNTITATSITDFLAQLETMPIEDRLVVESQVFLSNCNYFQKQKEKSANIRQFNEEVQNLGFEKSDIKKGIQVAIAYERFPEIDARGTVGSIGSIMLVNLAQKNYAITRNNLLEETDIFQLVVADQMAQERKRRKKEREQQKAEQVSKEKSAKIEYVGNGRTANLPPIYSEDAIASLMRQEEKNLSATIVAEGIIYREEILAGLWVKAEEVFKNEKPMVYSRTAMQKLQASCNLLKSYTAKIEQIDEKLKQKIADDFQKDYIPFQQTRKTLSEERVHWDKMRESKINQMIDYARACGITLDQVALYRNDELIYVTEPAKVQEV